MQSRPSSHSFFKNNQPTNYALSLMMGILLFSQFTAALADQTIFDANGTSIRLDTSPEVLQKLNLTDGLCTLIQNITAAAPSYAVLYQWGNDIIQLLVETNKSISTDLSLCIRGNLSNAYNALYPTNHTVFIVSMSIIGAASLVFISVAAARACRGSTFPIADASSSASAVDTDESSANSSRVMRINPN